MSTDKQVYPLYYEAKNDKVRKRLGIKGGFYWAEAKKLSIAISRGAVAIDDAGYDEEDFKKPVLVHLPVVNDLPPEGVFDTEFCNRYEKGGEDGITMVFIAPSPSAQDKPASTDNTNVNGEDMTEIEENMLLPISGQELPIRWLAQHGSEKPVTHVSREELQALHIARAEELPAVTALAISHKTSLLDPLEIRDLHKLVRDTDKVFPAPGNSSLGVMTAFFEAYLGADYTDRGLLTKEWMKGNRVSRITRTASGANAGGGNKTDRNPDLVHTLDTLDVEIAAATLPMDFNIYDIPGSVYRLAKEIVRKKESPFKEWSAALRATPGILDYSRAANFALIRSAHPELYLYPGRLREYINTHLTETDHEHPTEETLTAARHTPEKDILEEINRELAAECGTEEEKHEEEKQQPSGAMADEQATAETMEPDTTEHCQDTQSPDTQAQVNSVNPVKCTEHPHKENADIDQHHDNADETGEIADSVIAGDIEPGIYYGISNENYHAGPGVSKSQLDDIADTPALYLWRKNAPVDTTKTKTLDLGTAFHCRVLEPEEFSNRFIVAPEFNRRTNAGKEEEKAFLMECADTGKTVITAEEGRKIELMYQSVMALPLGQWLVESAGHAESSIYWEDPETGILCRCRPDKIIPEFHWIMDVKTTADIQRFKTAYYDYRYHVQDAFYSDGYEAQFGVQPTFVFLAVSTTVECGRYPVEIFMMGEEAKLAGQQEYHRNLRTLADCLNTDEWPAIKTLSLPRWAKEYAND
ncbi:PD-(D/E)XK nuclease-like domain-containing protein [Escherichia coli]|nr:PD-(D/E)XK nuclease-like domain-containing protein [Escherichia coli]